MLSTHEGPLREDQAGTCCARACRGGDRARSLAGCRAEMPLRAFPVHQRTRAPAAQSSGGGQVLVELGGSRMTIVPAILSWSVWLRLSQSGQRYATTSGITRSANSSLHPARPNDVAWLTRSRSSARTTRIPRADFPASSPTFRPAATRTASEGSEEGGPSRPPRGCSPAPGCRDPRSCPPTRRRRAIPATERRGRPAHPLPVTPSPEGATL